MKVLRPIMVIFIALAVIANVRSGRVLVVVPSDLVDDATALTGMTIDIGLSGNGEEPASHYWAESKASGIDTARVRFVCDSLECYYFVLSPQLTNTDVLDSLNLQRIQ
jgi:hypothetical protein